MASTSNSITASESESSTSPRAVSAIDGEGQDESNVKQDSTTVAAAASMAQAVSTTERENESSTAKVESGTKRSALNDEETKEHKKSRTEAKEVLDLAVSLGYKDGDRIEVEWDVEDDHNVATRWWGATLLPHDGRYHSDEENVAIRTLHYDPYPEGGFLESSKEDVIFLSPNLLADPTTREPLNYRRQGSEEELVVEANESSLEGAVNAILQGALAKNQAAWNTMTPAQQAQIASKIAQKKEKLVSLLMQQETKTVTGTDMNAILAQTMSE
uniref:Uncharacterized protein n=1 Tax=Entomoneis paludosa TaxID=265537 RepID=A0A7S2V7Q8_9STRA|eukprot:CAMPEP_0172454916 /NCGR_PEP_ID=MMETSP1065-20121228/11764_1 /TAXON_ID=265537 /ORGANISM="Amphiprora paludosa, Strain CCMP125" /LENGTH=271 /DNA_ID=CAMNT_0013207327 /DNA_START=1 /DNA_END=816 /DNA_ORIENTATION=-